ncbi:MAG: 50S ribosomal protein L29 [Chitinophagales bacterium]
MGANKAIKMKDITGMNDSDLNTRISQEREALRKMEFSHAVSSSENPMSIRAKRRDIARMLTGLNQRKAAK